MDIINSGSFTKALWPGVRKFFQMYWESWEPEWTALFEDLKSSKAFEEDVGESGFGLAHRKPEGQGVEYDTAEQNFVARYNHFVWALAFAITKEMVSDDLYGVASDKKSYALARSLRITKEILAANILNRGFDGKYTMGPDHDGEPLFSGVHPLGPLGGTYSNVLAVPADLSEAALEQMFIDINGYTDNRSLPIMAQPKQLTVHRANQFNASRILDSEYRSGSNLNDINAIRQNNYLPDGYRVNHYLTSPKAWFVKTTVPNCLIHFSRWGMEFSADNSFDTMNAKYKGVERYSLGWSEARGIAASPGL